MVESLPGEHEVPDLFIARESYGVTLTQSGVNPLLDKLKR